jgi:predicted HicB family RNase H-like nuclease
MEATMTTKQKKADINLVLPIPFELHKRFKLASVQREVSMAAWVREMIEKALKK